MSADLHVRNLSIAFDNAANRPPVLDCVDLDIPAGTFAGLVGESGSGKTLLAKSALGFLPPAASVRGGSVCFSDIDILADGCIAATQIRGKRIAMIFQNPRASLNPIRKIGLQIEDVIRRHKGLKGPQARAAAVAALESVRLPDPERIYNAYPFELSGGMVQRALIAVALGCNPDLLVADEPTTGLDVSLQTEIMDLIKAISAERRTSVLLITHDIEVAEKYCQTITVMRAGRVVEAGRTADVLGQPKHPYTIALINAIPSSIPDLASLRPLVLANAPAERREARGKVSLLLPVRQRGVPLLQARDLRMTYFRREGFRKTPFNAVEGVSFDITQGECLGMIGESGSGKSTISRIVAGLLAPTSGTATFGGRTITDLSPRQFVSTSERAAIQLVFQDPDASLNPSFTVRRCIADPLYRLKAISKIDAEAQVRETMHLVGLSEELLDRKPHQLSGGQKARVGIARAIATRPRLLILDEPTAALDVSVQAVIMHLLDDLRHTLGMSYLFITHHLELVRLMADRIAVMHKGQLVEIGKTADILSHPEHWYTKSLLALSGAARVRPLAPLEKNPS